MTYDYDNVEYGDRLRLRILVFEIDESLTESISPLAYYSNKLLVLSHLTLRTGKPALKEKIGMPACSKT